MLHDIPTMELCRQRAVPACALGMGLLVCFPLALGLCACAEQRCLADQDCPGNRVCKDSRCVTPQCASHEECDAQQVCERHVCVAGCRVQQDCDGGTLCFHSRCRSLHEECDCPLAPPFCAQDINPNSSSWGQQVCVEADPGSSAQGMGLFFGSVACGSCRGYFARLLRIRAQMGQSGERPVLTFVQLKDRPMSPQDVGEMLGLIDVGEPVDTPVVQDSDDLRIWESYGGWWYEFAIVSPTGCYTDKYVQTELTEDNLDAIQQTWTAAVDQQCAGAPR